MKYEIWTDGENLQRTFREEHLAQALVFANETKRAYLQVEIVERGDAGEVLRVLGTVDVPERAIRG